MNFQKAKNKDTAQEYENSKRDEEKTGSRLNELFSRSWEVFVIKRDEKTDQYIGKVACCALEPI